MAAHKRVDYLKLSKEAAEEFEKEKDPTTAGLPWPTYNGGKQFVCSKCGIRFDTSAGIARHQVYDCPSEPDAGR